MACLLHWWSSLEGIITSNSISGFISCEKIKVCIYSYANIFFFSTSKMTLCPHPYHYIGALLECVNVTKKIYLKYMGNLAVAICTVDDKEDLLKTCENFGTCIAIYICLNNW